MILARDKLQEAEFFLDRLREQDSGREFRYYLSAFVSAARSVTFALQTELRSKYGDEFDNWYEEQQTALRADRTARIVKGARDILLHQGSREPGYTAIYRSPQGMESVTFAYTIEQLADDAHLGEVVITFNPDEFKMSVKVDESQPLEQQMERIDAQLERKMVELTPVLLERAQRIIHEVEPEKLVSILGKDAVPIPTLLRDFEGYIEDLRRLVSDAESRFSPDSRVRRRLPE